MKSQHYQIYKNSETEWLEQIPEHWQEKRIKDLSFLQSGINITSDQIEEEGKYPVYGGNGLRGYFSQYTNEGEYVLIGRQGALCGNINYASGKFWATEHAVVVYLKPNIDWKWYGEMLRVMNLNQYSVSAAQPGLSVDRIKRLLLPVPPFLTQEAIAHYLDTKTAQIDRKIDLLTQKVKRYEELKRAIVNETVTRGLDKSVPMKDSGIEWIGEIPEHWNVLPLKDLASKKANSFVDGPFGSDLKSHEHTEYGIPLIQLNNIGIGTHYIQNLRFISEQKASFLSRHKAYPGELAIAKMAEPVARAAVIRDDYPLYVIVADCIKLKPNPNIALSHFLGYALNSIGVKSQAEVLSNGTTRIRIGLSTAKLLKVALPTLSEQQEIAEYLDRKTEQIEQIIENINFQIEKLKELRKTLINDVVTGKIKVIDN